MGRAEGGLNPTRQTEMKEDAPEAAADSCLTPDPGQANRLVKSVNYFRIVLELRRPEIRVGGGLGKSWCCQTPPDQNRCQRNWTFPGLIKFVVQFIPHFFKLLDKKMDAQVL